jgi:hypothetical protein
MIGPNITPIPQMALTDSDVCNLARDIGRDEDLLCADVSIVG